MISLAAQKFVSDIANDALQHCKMRGSGQSSRKSGKVSFFFFLCLLLFVPCTPSSHPYHGDSNLVVNFLLPTIILHNV